MPNISVNLLLRKDFCKLASSLEQGELRLLASEIGIQKSDPFVVLIQPSLLDLLEGYPALIKLGLLDLHGFLRQLEVQASHFACGVQFAYVARFLLNVHANFLPLVAKVELGLGKLGFRQSNIGGSLGREKRNGDLHANVDIVALEGFVELAIVVEFAQNIVL